MTVHAHVCTRVYVWGNTRATAIARSRMLRLIANRRGEEEGGREGGREGGSGVSRGTGRFADHLSIGRSVSVRWKIQNSVES